MLNFRAAMENYFNFLILSNDQEDSQTNDYQNKQRQYLVDLSNKAFDILI
jgi:hypothetical protein